jgi:phosphotransferase system HPr-like phosphotransfer protein
MMLAAGKGSVLKVTAEGEDATTVITELETLIRTRFGEE